MDLRHSDADEQFRTEFRSWLDAHLPADWRRPGFWGEVPEDEGFEMRRTWERSKAEAGFAGIAWPVEYGGRGGTPAMKAIYDEEMARAGAPHTVNPLGLAFLAPTVMVYGTEEQKREIIKPLLHCETIWCQGFSEPGAGSDLAAVATRAEQEGDEYVVNGQKVWTTNALHGDKIFTLARTSPAETKRHQGLSMLLIDMHQPGVEVRPIVQMSGASEFGEVFFTDARSPVTDVLGPAGNGWEVAMVLLSFERGSSAIGQYTEFRRQLEAVVDAAAQVDRDGRPATQDPVLRQALAQQVIELECLRLHSLHVLTQTSQGKDLGFEASMTKLQWSETQQDIFEAFEDVLGSASQVRRPFADGPDLDLHVLQQLALWTRSVTIWGGSSQVQRSIVAERVLGLPR